MSVLALNVPQLQLESVRAVGDRVADVKKSFDGRVQRTNARRVHQKLVDERPIEQVTVHLGALHAAETNEQQLVVSCKDSEFF